MPSDADRAGTIVEVGPGKRPKTVVALVPHTHWDREWYQPYEAMQIRLAEVLDEVLEQLSAGDSYAHFLFDGQMAMVDDYLALRPDAETGIRELAADGRATL